MADFQELVKKDPEYRSYRSILRTVAESANLEQVKKEAKSLHAQRPSRLLYKARSNPQKLIEAELEDSSNRSRLIELRVGLMNIQELLGSAVGATKKHLRAAYSAELSQYGGTVASRNAIVDRIFSKGMEMKSQVDLAIAILDLYIKDIDAAGYKHTNTRELLKIDFARKDTI